MMTGIKEIAKATGFSESTVSRALRDLPLVSKSTRELIRRCADDLDYVASSSAAGLANGRTQAVSVVVPFVNRWFPSTVLEGADSELRAANYDLILFNLGSSNGDHQREFRHSMLRHRGDAIIAVGLGFDESEQRQLISAGLPFIVVGGSAGGLRHVGIDQAAAGRWATQHLIDRGHRDIAHLTGGNEEQLGLIREVPEGRRKGYAQALEGAGLPLDPSRIIPGRFSVVESRAQILALLAKRGPRPTAMTRSVAAPPTTRAPRSAARSGWSSRSRIPTAS